MLKNLREDIKYEIIGILLVATGAIGLVSLATDRVGLVGHYLSLGLTRLAGWAGYLIPVMSIVVGIQIMLQRRMFRPAPKGIGAGLIFLAVATALHLGIPSESAVAVAMAGEGGGLAGAGLSLALEKALGPAGRLVVLLALFPVGIILAADRSLLGALAGIKEWLFPRLSSFRDWLIDFVTVPVAESEVQGTRDAGEGARSRARTRKSDNLPAGPLQLEATGVDHSEDCQMPTIHLMDGTAVKMTPDGGGKKVPEPQPVAEVLIEPGPARPPDYQLPPVELLNSGSNKKGAPAHQDIAQRTRILEETLESFGVKARVVEIHQGPTITRYEIQPAPGIRVSKITTLQNDLALSLAAPQVRIEAPIPGKAAVGIEVPNKEVAPVLLRDVIEAPEYREATSRLAVAFGKDIAGRAVFGNLEKMPHLLIAGATGSGKSVCINTIIMSLLLRARPDEVKLMMIDPKMVELSHYNGIPHLIAPVVTDPKKAAGFLRWAVKEMENRYELFASAGVRDIGRYNADLLEETGDRQGALPHIVLIVDELADLMMVAPVDVEDAICRLAQMARAAGIHLVVATQRPSVDVITGLIKANIPSRIAFAVASQIDSRTILDMGGAEKLLGKGDMLYHPVGSSKPLRVQGAFVSEKEIEAVVEHTKRQGQPEYGAEPVALEERGDDGRKAEGGSDDLFPTAVRIVMEHGQASVSILQRRLRISYNRAARLIDDMENRGLIGPYQGSKPRDVLIGTEDYARIFGQSTGRGDE